MINRDSLADQQKARADNLLGSNAEKFITEYFATGEGSGYRGTFDQVLMALWLDLEQDNQDIRPIKLWPDMPRYSVNILTGDNTWHPINVPSYTKAQAEAQAASLRQAGHLDVKIRDLAEGIQLRPSLETVKMILADCDRQADGSSISWISRDFSVLVAVGKIDGLASYVKLDGAFEYTGLLAMELSAEVTV